MQFQYTIFKYTSNTLPKTYIRAPTQTNQQVNFFSKSSPFISVYSMRKHVKSNEFRSASFRNFGNMSPYILKGLRTFDVLKNIHRSVNDPMLPSENFPGWLRSKFVYSACTSDSVVRPKRALRTHLNTLTKTFIICRSKRKS